MPLSQVTRADISIPARPAIQESDIHTLQLGPKDQAEGANEASEAWRDELSKSSESSPEP